MIPTAPALRFLVDVGVGVASERALQAAGHDVLSVRSIDARMPDEQIVRLASEQERMVVTMDTDFGELVYHSGLSHAGVLLLRMEDANGLEKAEALTRIVAQYGDRVQYCFCVYQNGRLRIRSR
jgi:predicted nuclease of predicted toxin-antitoxin system